jgi:hypothetical protein
MTARGRALFASRRRAVGMRRATRKSGTHPGRASRTGLLRHARSACVARRASAAGVDRHLDQRDAQSCLPWRRGGGGCNLRTGGETSSVLEPFGAKPTPATKARKPGQQQRP